MKKLAKWFAVFAFIGLLAGCARTAPIEQINTVVAAGHTTDQMKNAIMMAGIQRQWIMTDAGPGVIKATQKARDHSATVNIKYTATGYSIIYDSSFNLMASGGSIHKNYNRWVRNLDKDIQVNLAAATLK